VERGASPNRGMLSVFSFSCHFASNVLISDSELTVYLT